MAAVMALSGAVYAEAGHIGREEAQKKYQAYLLKRIFEVEPQEYVISNGKLCLFQNPHGLPYANSTKEDVEGQKYAFNLIGDEITYVSPSLTPSERGLIKKHARKHGLYASCISALRSIVHTSDRDRVFPRTAAAAARVKAAFAAISGK